MTPEERIQEKLNKRELDSAELVKSIYNFTSSGMLQHDESRYCIINTHPKDHANLKKDFVSGRMATGMSIGDLLDFMFMGYQFYVMRSLDIEEGKWVITVGEAVGRP